MPATYYDPDNPPIPSEWLALGESERIRLAQSYHVSARIKLPNVKAHAAIHAIVENQIATGFGPSCRAVERLQREGLTRHEAIHAIGSVVAEFAYASLHGQSSDSVGATQNRMNRAIESLFASTWNSQANGEGSDG
jgi:hypothetical protein